MNLKKVPPFRVFSSPILDRFLAYWTKERFVLTAGYDHRPVFALTREDAEELIDSLQKFMAVGQ